VLEITELVTADGNCVNQESSLCNTTILPEGKTSASVPLESTALPQKSPKPRSENLYYYYDNHYYSKFFAAIHSALYTVRIQSASKGSKFLYLKAV
jgi:hypothetical protein